MLCQSLAERLQVTFFFATLEQWRNPQRYLGRWRSNFFPFTVLLNPKPVRMISERSIDSILLHFRMESRFLRLADLVVQRMPWGLEELEESSDYNQFGLRCCGPCITYSSSIAKMSFVLQQQKNPVFVIADQSDSWSFKQKKRLQQPQILKLLLKESGSMAAVRFPDKHKRRSAIAAPKDGGGLAEKMRMGYMKNKLKYYKTFKVNMQTI